VEERRAQVAEDGVVISFRHKVMALPRRVGDTMLALANPLLAPLEHKLERDALARNAARHPPVFIIGAPRSGSTLLYKALTDGGGFAYFNELSARFFRTPCVGSALSRRFRVEAPRGFEISYGSMSGWGSPHECGQFWYRWFPRGMDVYAPAGSLAPPQRARLRQEVLAMSAQSDASMAFKNLFNSLRIGALAEVFPEACFIVCRRDPLQNALSLLRGRIEQNGDKHAWWTLPPREVRELQALPYPAQVAGQVHFIERQIERDAQLAGADRFLTVRYEDFCRDVHAGLQRIHAFLRGRGCTPPMHLDGIPRQFEVRRVTGLEPADVTAVTAAVKRFNEI
jgi:hypothetical protein